MKSTTLIYSVKPAILLLALGYLQPAFGDTRSYAATTDFPITDAGVVPYYSEAPGRPSLAINAADESYRDLFARATVVYDGNEGIHDLTIVALAELDGEAEYRLLVNGELVGTATNPEVSVDYTVVRHTFEDITIPAGAVLGVESLANTNGKIPEGDGTAFARGRWTTLELLEASEEEQPEVTAPTDIDLTLVVTSNKLSMNQNEAFELEVTLSNSASSITATEPQVDISIPLQAVSLVSADQCVETALGLRCTFPELPADTSQTMTLSFTSTDEALRMVIPAFASADQNDRDGTNNMVNLTIDVIDINAEPEPEEPVITEQPTPMASASDGGSASWLWLLLSMPSFFRRKTCVS